MGFRIQKKGHDSLKKRNSKTALISLTLIGIMLLTAILLVAEYLHLYFPGLWHAFSTGNEQELQNYISGQDRLYGAALLWLLSFVQVLSIVIPAMPVQLVAGMTLGPWRGFLITFSSAIAADMTAFWIAHRASKMLRCIAKERPKIGKMLNSLSVSRNRTYYTVMAILLPGLPNGAIPYAAANSGIKAKVFFCALVIALPIPTIMTCIAGRLVITGGILYSVALLSVLYAVVGVLFLLRNVIPEKMRKRVESRKVQ